MTSTFTQPTKNNVTFVNVAKSSATAGTFHFLIDSTFSFLIDNSNLLLIGEGTSGGDIIWVNSSKH